MKLKNTWIALLLALTCLTQSPAHADSARGKKFGVGFILGVPTGFSFQANAHTNQTINGGVAWSFDNWTQVWVDFTFHFPHFISDLVGEYSPIDTYLGLGGGILFAGQNRFTRTDNVGGLLRIPLGFEYKLSGPQLGFFVELVPSLVVGPITDGELQGGIGGRFYF
jgi:hypothetical protein